jgi:hypothetical protein
VHRYQLIHINAVHRAIEGGVDEKDTIKDSKMKVNEGANGLKIYLST